jgi:predicted transcriptional regulator
MIVVFIRTILKNRKKRKEYVSNLYDRDSREKTAKKIRAKKAEVVLDEEENVEYNYEEAAAVEEEAVIDVDAINQNPEDLQEDGGSEETTSEETTNEEPSSEN